MDAEIQGFCDALETLDRARADAIFDEAISKAALEGRSPIDVVTALIMPALSEIGRGWHEGALALSQVYMSGRICEQLVEQVLPPSDPDRKRQPRSAIVVLHDHHMLGKRIVYAMMRASGFELFDYGRMELPELVERVIADRLRVLMVSALMLPSALKVRALRDALDARGYPLKIIVGGAPFLMDNALWREVGADAMGRDAAEAVTIITGWMEAAR
ncbi:B12-binding domain-containing protein [Myxococcota bacterium]|nr:B12-binding domain-containing protein [Myxococcota bacterium]MBU1898465.1 B12-binding domain-containing protein [Myxococcota bacterium]